MSGSDNLLLCSARVKEKLFVFGESGADMFITGIIWAAFPQLDGSGLRFNEDASVWNYQQWSWAAKSSSHSFYDHIPLWSLWPLFLTPSYQGTKTKGLMTFTCVICLSLNVSRKLQMFTCFSFMCMWDHELSLITAVCMQNISLYLCRWHSPNN